MAHEPGALGGAAGEHLAEHRLERRPVEPQPDLFQHIGFHVGAREAGEIERHQGDVPALVERLELRALPLQCRLQHAPAQLLPRRDRLAVDRANRVAGVHAGSRGQRAGRRRAEDRSRFGQAVHEEPRVDQHREDEVEERSGDDDGEALPDALPVEGARELGRLDRPLALVQHLHVTAERDGGEHPFGAVGPQAPGRERPSEAHREPQHLHFAGARDQVVPVLVHDDQHAEGDDERDHGLHEAHAATASTQAAAARRASRSAAITAPRSDASVAGTASSVSAITRAMLVKGSRPARKASTATSLAALSSAGAVPPGSGARRAART